MSSKPVNPAIKNDIVYPMTAPKVPNPRITREGIKMVLIVDWTISVMLLSCIFSMPVKAAWAEFRNAPVKIEKEAIWIRGVMVGRWNAVVARKSESNKESTESDKPRTVSKNSPETKMLFTLAVWFSELYWAEYLIMATFTPQSLKFWMRFGATKAIAYKPYSLGASNRATSMVPTAEIMVEATNPQKMWKPPLTETLAISAALLILFFPQSAAES